MSIVFNNRAGAISVLVFEWMKYEEIITRKTTFSRAWAQNSSVEKKES